jgi:uncharacterized protein (DUF2126 family)
MMGDEKTYIAYSIYDYEQGCGCGACGYHNVYDSGGNNYKKFTSYEEAVEAAKKCMKEHDDDRWNVI